MRNVRDSQDTHPQLCAATKFGPEFGVPVQIPGAKAMEFIPFPAGHFPEKSGAGGD
jgi:hypothetical protein